MTKKTILHLLAPARIGGLESVVIALGAGQAKRGHTVHAALILPENDDQHPVGVALHAAGAHVHPVVVKGRDYSSERRQVEMLCREARIEVIHSHGYRPDVVDLGVARRLGLATVTTVHGFTSVRGLSPRNLRNRLYEALQLRAFRRFDAVVAVSRPLVSLLRAKGIPPERIHLIPNAFRQAAAPFSRVEARRQLGIGHDDFLAGWVGRVTREKGGDVFVDALLAMGRDAPAAVILGDGSERPALEAKASAAGSPLRWLGTVEGAGALFRAFDVFVLSSRTEGTPIALLEAMSAGIAVIATPVGGVPDVIGEGEGWLVPSENPQALAAALRAVQANPEDAARRASAAQRRLASAFAFEPWLDAYEKVYESIAK